MRSMRRAALLGIAVGMVAADVVAAAPAMAEVPGYTVTTEYVRPGDRFVSVRARPDVGSERIRTVKTGTAVTIECQTKGGRLGLSSNRDNRTWDRLTDGSYVHDMVTDTPGDEHAPLSDGGYAEWSSTIPKCSTPAAPAGAGDLAADWAAAQVGRSTAADEDLAGYDEDQWKPGAVGEWSGDAMKFVAIAWKHAGRDVVSGDAGEQYAAYKSRIETGDAPRGAIVFYPDWTDDGHVAISAGDGTVYTTIGVDGHAVPISQVDEDLFGTPAGWVIP